MRLKNPLFVLFFFCLLLWGQTGLAGDNVIVIPATDFYESDFLSPSSKEYIRQTACLGCIPEGAKWESVRGKVKYRFEVAEAGWYTLDFDPAKGAGQAWYRFQFDEEQPFYLHNNSATYFLGSGKHTLTAEANFWIGFTKVKAFVLTRSNGSVVQSIRVEKNFSDIVGKGESVVFDIHYAKQVAGKRITIEARNGKTGKKYRRALILPKGNGDGQIKGSIRLDTPGSYQIVVHSGRASDAVKKRFNVQVVGGNKKPTTLVKGELVAEIDCSAVPPKYYGGGMPMWTKSDLGVYPESGEKGYRNRENQKNKDISWFAYPLKVPTPNVPYLIEVDYPDNTLRTFGISVIEANGMFPSSIGVDSGGEYRPSYSVQTASLIRWPTESEMRVVIMNAHDGMKAAISGIRMYRLKEKSFSPRQPSAGRQYAEWYEENLTFFNLVGMQKNLDNAGTEEACSRWMQLLATYDVNTMIMPVNAYGARMYSSGYEVDSNPAERDLVKILLLEAEKWRMGFIAEFHPMASMLLKWHPVPPEKNLFTNKEGQSYVERNPFAPRYNLLYPENQDWLIGLVADFVARYKDNKALTGVSLRFMEWQNSGLYNFHNLDWGYDDYTMSVFSKETGVAVPAMSGQTRFSKRYKWIRENAAHEWKDWRGQKVAALVERIRDAITEIRPDLILYLHETALEVKKAEHMRRVPRYGRGLEMKYLNGLDNVVVLNDRYRHGRKMSDFHVWAKEYSWEVIRDELLQPEKLRALKGRQFGNFVFSQEYMEAGANVISPSDLGFPAKAKRQMWSASVEPAGRNALERYALAMAETDAVFLGNGGNNYTFGPDVVTDEFLPEYYSLPKKSFTKLRLATDSLVVREHAGEERYMFYVVNRESVPCKIKLSFSEVGGLKSLSGGQLLMENGTEFDMTVKPFEMRACETTIPQMRISSSEVVVPEDIIEQRRTMIDECKSIAPKLAKGSFERKAMNNALTAAESAAQTGKWWEVQAVLQQAELIRIYEQVGRYPEGLRFGIAR